MLVLSVPDRVEHKDRIIWWFLWDPNMCLFTMVQKLGYFSFYCTPYGSRIVCQ